MSQNLIQTSFSSGELAPSIAARTDIAKYHTGCARLRNFFVDYRSGASSRTGTELIIQCLNSAKNVRLVEFQYSVITAYVIEFGDSYVRFITDGGAVLEAAFNVSAASLTIPGTVTVPGHNFSVGNWIWLADLGGSINYNNRFYTITAIVGNVLTLANNNLEPVNASFFPAYTSGGTASRVYTLTSPYPSADLDLLKFNQSASVLTITHPGYAPRTLTRTGPASWAFETIDFETDTPEPTALTGIGSSAGGANYSYIATAVINGEESGPSGAAFASNYVNMTNTAGTITLTWTQAFTADLFYIYKAQMNIGAPVPPDVAYGYIGQSFTTTFIDTNIVPDFSTAPPIPTNPFAANNHPGVSIYFQQRQVFAGSLSLPITFWMSQPGNFANFNVSDPIQADDAITGTLVGSQVNAIKWMVVMPGGLLALTSKGAWQISAGSQGAPVTPANIVAVPQAYNGIADIRPLILGDHLVYVQEKGAIVRDLQYNIYSNIYTGSDISVYANHLFYGFTVKEWTWAEEPFKLIPTVRDDGTLLILTYVKEQEILGWSRYDTQGQYKSVAAVTEGEVDAVYVVVERYLGGQWLKFIERFAEREFKYGAEDAWCVDCSVQSTLDSPDATLIADGVDGTVTFTASNGIFASGSVGDIIRMGGGIATITTYINTTTVVGTMTRPITDVITDTDIPLRAFAGEWTIATPFINFVGLDHLDGELVSILADGSVVTAQVVTNGSVTLPSPASKVVAGLPFIPQLQTMNLDLKSGETVQGKRKKINALTVRCDNTRGLQAGSTFDTLTPFKLDGIYPLDTPAPLVNGDIRIVMDPSWNTEGRICLQINDPLPATILGVIPEITVGDN